MRNEGWRPSTLLFGQSPHGPAMPSRCPGGVCPCLTTCVLPVIAHPGCFPLAPSSYPTHVTHVIGTWSCHWLLPTPSLPLHHLCCSAVVFPPVSPRCRSPTRPLKLPPAPRLPPLLGLLLLTVLQPPSPAPRSQMAAAGFYHTPTVAAPDLVKVRCPVKTSVSKFMPELWPNDT